MEDKEKDKVQMATATLDKIIITTYLHPGGNLCHVSAECINNGMHEIAVSDVFYGSEDAINDAVTKLIKICVPMIQFI